MNLNKNAAAENNLEEKNKIINEHEQEPHLKNIKLDIRKVDPIVYLPKLLFARLKRRENVKAFSIVFFLYNIILLIIGILYIDASASTNKYIGNGDDFWNFVFDNKIRPKELSLLFSFAGIFVIFSISFNIMNGFVILNHIFKGGLKNRLSYSIYTTTVIQIVDFGFSFLLIVKYGLVVNLNILLFILNCFHLVITIVFFYYIRKIIVKEEDYMFPLKTLLQHKLDYFIEYEKKLNS